MDTVRAIALVKVGLLGALLLHAVPVASMRSNPRSQEVSSWNWPLWGGLAAVIIPIAWVYYKKNYCAKPAATSKPELLPQYKKTLQLMPKKYFSESKFASEIDGIEELLKQSKTDINSALQAYQKMLDVYNQIQGNAVNREKLIKDYLIWINNTPYFYDQSGQSKNFSTLPAAMGWISTESVRLKRLRG